MRRHAIILLLALSMVFASCSSSTFFAKGPSDIQSIALVTPYAYLTDAFGDWSTTYLPSASRFNSELVSYIVMTSLGLPIQEEVAFGFDFSDPDPRLGPWLRNLSRIDSDEARTLVIPEEIRTAVRQSGCPYGMIITDVGYVKNSDQLAMERVLEATSRVLEYVINGSMNMSRNTEAYTNGVYALVFDSQTGHVVWFGTRPRQYNRNPLDHVSLMRQLNTLFKDFR